MAAAGLTAFVDACVLAGALKRNLLLSFAEAELFRLRWSDPILVETRRAIERILTAKGLGDAGDRAARATRSMRDAFEDAMVSEFEAFLPLCAALPDPQDAHVVAAALKTRATLIVTDNLQHFPEAVLRPLNLERCSADTFLAGVIAFEIERSVAAVARLRGRLNRPDKTASQLLADIEAVGLVETAAVLRAHRLRL